MTQNPQYHVTVESATATIVRNSNCDFRDLVALACSLQQGEIMTITRGADAWNIPQEGVGFRLSNGFIPGPPQGDQSTYPNGINQERVDEAVGEALRLTFGAIPQSQKAGFFTAEQMAEIPDSPESIVRHSRISHALSKIRRIGNPSGREMVSFLEALAAIEMEYDALADRLSDAEEAFAALATKEPNNHDHEIRAHLEKIVGRLRAVEDKLSTPRKTK